MLDIGPSTDNETLADLLAELTEAKAFQNLSDVHQNVVIEAEQRIREMPDEE